MIILDSCEIILFFSEIKKPETLFKLIGFGHELYIPNGVLKEIEKGKGKYTTCFLLKKAIKNKQIHVFKKVNQKEIEKIKNRYPLIGLGESEVIFWGKLLDSKNKNYKCIIDDGPARIVAKDEKIKFMGVKGLLTYMRTKGLLTKKEENQLLKEVKKTKFRL